jgi:hypothetical protein
MEQLVILLLIALISFINWLIKKSAALREARKQEQGAAKSGDSLRSEQSAAKTGDSLRSEPSRVPEAEPEISMRRLREALGLPDEAQPPALPKRRIEQRVPPPLAPPPLPPALPPARPVVSHISLTPAHEEYRFIEMPHRAGKPARSRVEVAGSPSRIRELLGSAGGLRDAVVLSEILGPPKCLRAHEGQFLR